MDPKVYLFLVTLTVISMVMCQDMSADVVQDLMTPMRSLGEACGYDSCPAVIEGMLNVHIVPHSHGELGFSKTFDEHFSGRTDIQNQKSDVNWKRILDFVITELWNNQERKFTLSDIPYLFEWWSKRDGTVRRMVFQLLRQGRLHIVGGGWGMPDEACPSYHALIDQFTRALGKLNKTLGPCARPLVAWQADNFGHSREFTNLASMLGFDGLFISPISFEDELDRMSRTELEMVWRGSDDLGPESDLFTHKLFDGYWSPPGFCFGSACSDPLIYTSNSDFKNVEERVTAFIDTVKNRQGYHYATNNVMVVMGKRDGYFDATMWFNNIDKLIINTNAKSAGTGDKVNLIYSAPACYLKAVHDSSPSLPIKQDDFMPITFDKTSHMTGLYTSRPTIKYMAREGHMYLQMAKQLHVFSGLSAREAKLYDDLSWVTGAFQDHNIITGSMRDYVKDYYTLKMFKAVEKSRLLLKKAFNKLRKSPPKTAYYRCSFNISSCRNTNALRSFVVIYNPLSWPVTVPVRLPMVLYYRHKVFNPKLQTVRAVSMKMSASVLKIPNRNTTADYELIFMAENIPPMGFRSYFIETYVTTATEKKKRSIIKNLNRSKKKFLAHQTDQMKIDDESMMDADEEYETDDEPTAGEANKPLHNIPANNKAEEREKKIFAEPEIFYPTEEESWRLTIAPPANINIEDLEIRRQDESPKLTEEEIKHFINPESVNESENVKLPEPVTEKENGLKPVENKSDNESRNLLLINPTREPKFNTSNNKYNNQTHKPTIIKKPSNADQYFRHPPNEFTNALLPTNPASFKNSFITLERSEALQSTDKLDNTEEPASIERSTLPAVVKLTSASSKTDVNRIDVTPSPLENDSTTLHSQIYPSEPERSNVAKEVDSTVKSYQYPFAEEEQSMGVISEGTSSRRLSNDPEDPDFDEAANYFQRVSTDKFIKNKYVKVHLDAQNKVSRVSLSNGVELALTINLHYYASDDPARMQRPDETRPGAYIFKPMDPTPVLVREYARSVVHKTYLVEEVQYTLASWAGLVLRVYAERPIIELDWVVGPVPIDNSIGKDVFIRYSTDLRTNGVFYTDSNGRQTMKRVRNSRPTFTPLLNNIPSNFYPVTSKIHIEDPKKNIRFSVLNDRAQGGTSLNDGQIDLMVHRRILTADEGIQAYLNDTESGQGIVVRGKHIIYISKADYKPNKIFEKKLAKEIELAPQIFASRPDYEEDYKEEWYGHNNEFHGVLKKLPAGVQILTLQAWHDNTLLLRLENYLEKADTLKSRVKTVFVRDLFANIKIKSLKETTLGANVWVEENVPTKWNARDKFLKNFNDFYNGNGTAEFSTDDERYREPVNMTAGIVLIPQEIRTFIATYEFYT